MRAPSKLPDGVLVAAQHADGAGAGVPDVEDPNDAVDAGGSDDGVPILVPVVSQALRRANSAHVWQGTTGSHLRGGMDGDGQGQMVARTRRSPEVEDAEMRIPGHSRDNVGIVRREGGAVDAAVHGQSQETGLGLGIPDLDGAVPRGGQKGGLVAQIPMHGKDFAGVLAPLGNGEAGADANIKELDAAIAAGRKQLVLVRLAPARVEEAVLGLKVFFADDARVGQAQDEEATIAHEAEVCAAGDAEAGVEEGRVFDCIAVEACGAELEHCGTQ